jgi:hypothetical protein
MRKIILINGFIAGVIVSVLMLTSWVLMQDGYLDMDKGMVVGYTSMVISLSIIFFAIKTYRDQYNAGKISFGRGLAIGLLITLMGSILYAASWQVFSYTIATDFSAVYIEHQLEGLRNEGATEAEIQEEKANLERNMSLYEIPVLRFLITMMELLPVGIIISLIAAGILRKPQILPASR